MDDSYEIVNEKGETVKIIMTHIVGCEDCGRPYGDEHGFPDLVVSHNIWEKLMPGREGGGLLCPCCMCKRAHDLGIQCDAIFTSGPFVDRSSLINSFMEEARLCPFCGGLMTNHKKGCIYVEEVNRIDKNIIKGSE